MCLVHFCMCLAVRIVFACVCRRTFRIFMQIASNVNVSCMRTHPSLGGLTANSCGQQLQQQHERNAKTCMHACIHAKTCRRAHSCRTGSIKFFQWPVNCVNMRHLLIRWKICNASTETNTTERENVDRKVLGVGRSVCWIAVQHTLCS